MKFIYLLVILSIMASFAIINAEDVEVRTFYDSQARVKLINPTGNLYKPWERPKDAPRFLKNAATIEYGTFHKTPYQDCVVETLGATKYDMQHNTTVGRNIVLDYEGGIHVSWMWCEDTTSGWRDRFIYYNYVSPTGSVYFKPPGSRIIQYGTIVSLGAKAGYTNITFTRLPCMSDPGTILNVPLVSYHYTISTMPGHDYHSEVSWDGAWRMYGCAGGGRGGFVVSEGFVPGGMPWAYTNSPEPNGYFPDVTSCHEIEHLVAIWPKLDADDEGNIFVVASPSEHDTVCGIPVPSYVAFWSGSPEYNALGELEKYDYYGPQLIDFSLSIDVDIVVNRITNQVAVATYSVYDTFDCFPGDSFAHSFSLDYILRTSENAGTTWTPREYVFGHGGLPPSPSDYDTSYMAVIRPDTLPGGLDTIYIAEMSEYVGTWRPYRSLSDVSITYDKDGYIHMAFSACKMVTNDSLNPCSLSIWYGSGILYWNSRDKEIRVVSSRFSPPRPSWVELKVNDPAHTYLEEMITVVRPSISVDDSDYIYIVWEQAWPMFYTYHDSLITFVNDRLGDTLTDAQMDTVGVMFDSALSPGNGYLDRSDAPDLVANYDIMGSSSKDGGMTWLPIPINITNSHAGACTAGHCLGEIDISQTRIVDDYLHIFAVQDLDCGKLLKYVSDRHDSLNGAVTVNPIIYIKYDKRLLWPDRIIEYPTSSIPEKPSLVKAYPNPFNTSVNLEWTVPVAGDVKVEIIDIKGRVIKEIYSGKSHPGKFNAVWDGKDGEDEPMPSGIYIFRMKAENAEDSQKIHLIK